MKIIVVLMAVVFMAGMAIWLFLFKNCYEMIQDIRSGTRKVPVIRKAVDKYDDCCKLEIAVNNTEVFVEKIIENEKICGLRMKAWQRIAGMVKYGIALLGIFSAVLFKGNTDEVYICAAVAAMCCVSLHFMDCMADVDGYLKDTVVELVDYLENREKYDALGDCIVYTGTIDAYYKYQFGKLEYRSLRFESEVLDEENHQGVAVVNYTDRETPYTRIIEHKHFEFGTQPKTVITREYPVTWQEGMEPYYPVNDEKNQALYQKYAKLAEKEEHVIFGGRLGEYKYYDMDKVIASAMACAKEELNML